MTASGSPSSPRTARSKRLPRHAARAPAKVTGPARRRSQAERSDESEIRLLEAAARVIEGEGFAAATFDRIGELAGYSRGLASAKFGSKDGLVRAVIAFVQRRLEARTTAALAMLDRPDATELILSWTDTLLEVVQTDELVRAYFVMMAVAVGNRADNRPAFLDAHEQVRVRLRDLIEAGQASGTISAKVDADATALSIGSLQLGIAVELLLDPTLDIGRMRATARQAVRGMLGI
ncbi:TetR/AcrR family transcriptional regulator [Sphingomonas lacunae]|nr:helix-turn-helix domain-containing protein [Sphingomonas lacunae]